MIKTIASIIILTKNGEKYIRQVLESIYSQKCDFPFEVIIIDSGSSDKTLDVVKNYRVRLYNINSEDFNHGLTRDYGASLAQGDYLVYLVQDAIPGDEYWLKTLINEINTERNVAGVYCKNIAHKEASVLIKYRTENWYKDKRIIKEITDFGDYYKMAPAQKFELIAFDNVCSCIKKSVWEKFGFERNFFAEDLAWSKKVLEARYKIIYTNNTFVYHSHNRSIKEIYQRAIINSRRLFEIVGFNVIPDFKSFFLILKNTIISEFNYLRYKGYNFSNFEYFDLLVFNFFNILGLYKGSRLAVKDNLKRKKSILFIAPWLEIGGAEEVLYNIIKYLSESGFFNIFIATTEKSENPWKNKFFQISPDIFFLPELFNEKELVKLKKYKNKKIRFEYIEKEKIEFLKNLIEKNNIDLIHISNSKWGYINLPVFKYLFPEIRTVDLLHIVNQDWDFFKYSKSFDEFLDRRITISKYNRSYLIDQHINEDKIKIIYNGIDVFDKFNPEKLIFDIEFFKKENKIPTGKKIVTFIGRLSEQKQPELFVEIADYCLKSGLENLHFVIAGGGELEEKIKQKIGLLGINNYFTILGFREDINKILKISDIFVMPSKEEGFPIVAMEAMAMKVPVLAADVTGLSELIQDKIDGFLVEQNYVDKYFQTINYIINNPEKIKEITAIARKKIESNHSLFNMGEEYKNLYLSIFY